MLEEAGVKYDRVTIDIRDPNRRGDPDFAKASPMGKVPALADNGAFLADSAAICMYVADKYPKAGLAPAIDDPQRGKYLWWMVYTPGVIEPALGEKFSGAKGDRMRSGWGDFDLMIETFEKGLGKNEWILGDKFSAADVMMGSSAAFMKQFGMLPKSPVLEAYAERSMARPAYKRAAAMDEESA
jgi:glutathione S-transferase